MQAATNDTHESNKPEEKSTRWSVIEIIKTPAGQTIDSLATFAHKKEAIDWMFDYANRIIGENPTVIKHPSTGPHDSGIATGEVNTTDDTISIAVSSENSYHNRFLSVEEI